MKVGFSNTPLKFGVVAALRKPGITGTTPTRTATMAL